MVKLTNNYISKRIIEVHNLMSDIQLRNKVHKMTASKLKAERENLIVEGQAEEAAIILREIAGLESSIKSNNRELKELKEELFDLESDSAAQY